MPEALPRRRVLAWLGACAAGPAAAQAPVYESRDEQGPVFSDRPSPGASRVDIGRPNVIQAPPAPASAPTRDAAAPAPYRALTIDSPPDQGTVHSNTGAFDVVLQATPRLRAGDRVKLVLDGTLLPRSYAAGRIRLDESDWRAAAGSDVQHALQAQIVDPAGQVLIVSKPVVFYVQRASAARRGR